MKIRSFLTFAFTAFALVQTYGQNGDLNATKDRGQKVEVSTKPFFNVVQIEIHCGKADHGTRFFIRPRVPFIAGYNLCKRQQFIFTRSKSVNRRVGATSPNNNISKEKLKSIQNDNIFTIESFNKSYNIYEDFAIFILPDETLYNKMGGHFKLNVVNGDSVPAVDIHIGGYLGNKPYCSMWTEKAKDVFQYLNENNNPDILKYIKYDFTTETGLNGGPIWFTDNNIDHIFAIYTDGNNIVKLNVLQRHL